MSVQLPGWAAPPSAIRVGARVRVLRVRVGPRSLTRFASRAYFVSEANGVVITTTTIAPKSNRNRCSSFLVSLPKEDLVADPAMPTIATIMTF